MSSNLAIVSRTLDEARRDLQDTADHLAQTTCTEEPVARTQMRLAIEASARAIGLLALSVERLAELDVAEPAEPALLWRD